MSKTEFLKKFITKKLKNCCKNIHYEQSSPQFDYPYTVFTLEKRKDEIIEIYTIEINIFDENISTKNIEKIADNIEKTLNDTVFQEKEFSITIDLNIRNTVFESNKNIKRRRLLFIGKCIFKE